MKKKINLLYAYHAGANCQYFETMLKVIESEPNFCYKIVCPVEFLTINLDNYNVLVYQTFPDNQNRRKFNPEVIKKLDEVFLKFKSLKILLDSFDMGDYNGYERFGKDYPRIKHVPSYQYLENFNVVSTLITTGWQQKKYSVIPLEIERDILIHCAFTVGVYPHKNRERVMSKLKEKYYNATSFVRVPVECYNDFLQRVQISVVTGGFGETSGSVYPSLQSGTLLFVHEKISEVKLFPFVDLVDGKDYVSFNLRNFSEKLDWIIQSKNKRDEIRLSGQKKFFEGFDPDRSAKEFLEYLNLNVKRG